MDFFGTMLLLILTLFYPRIFAIVLWLFTDLFKHSYDTVIWPVLGWFFMPTTTVTYLWLQSTGGFGEKFWPSCYFIIAIIVDVLRGYADSTTGQE